MKDIWETSGASADPETAPATARTAHTENLSFLITPVKINQENAGQRTNGKGAIVAYCNAVLEDDWRNSKPPEKGEEKAHACVIAC